jgi:DNA-binding ferritin-like protein (Dps family)
MNKKTKELNRMNNSLDKQVNPENKEAFTDMICYLRGANISGYHQELVRHDLTEMVLSAQQRGENIRAVIGEDYQAFCDDVIASLPPVTLKQRIIDFFDIVCWSLSILGAINIVMANETIALIHNLISGNPLNYYISVSIGSVISIGIIVAAASVMVEVFIKNAFQIGKKKRHDRRKAFLVGGGLMAVFLLVAWLGRATLFNVHIFIACAVVLVLYIAHKVLSQLA